MSEHDDTSSFSVRRPRSPVERGELMFSRDKGTPAVPFQQLLLPWHRGMGPRTFRYTIINVSPDFHDLIHTSVLEAYRRHLEWSDDETPHVTFEPDPMTHRRSYVLVTMATQDHFYAVFEAEELVKISVQLPGGPKLLHRRIETYDLPPNLVILAASDLPADYDAKVLHNALADLLRPFGNACDSWDVLLDHPASGIRDQRTGKVVVVGQTFRTYFDDVLKDLISSTVAYRGHEYPVMVGGGRPRPREANPLSTGALAGDPEDSDDDDEEGEEESGEESDEDGGEEVGEGSGEERG